MKLNMKMIFIVNESAGRGKSKKIIPNIEKECKNQNIEFEIRYITKEKWYWWFRKLRKNGLG